MKRNTLAVVTLGMGIACATQSNLIDEEQEPVAEALPSSKKPEKPFTVEEQALADCREITTMTRLEIISAKAEIKEELGSVLPYKLLANCMKRKRDKDFLTCIGQKITTRKQQQVFSLQEDIGNLKNIGSSDDVLKSRAAIRLATERCKAGNVLLKRDLAILKTTVTRLRKKTNQRGR